MNWSINLRSHRCVHSTGAIVYFDPKLTRSSALKCVGPFLNRNVSVKDVKAVMRQLTIQLEELFSSDHAYVLWGTYEDKPGYLEHHFSILGSVCGFVPAVSMRGDLLGEPSLSSEWRQKGRMLIHCSGLNVVEATHNTLDPSAYHPSTISTEIDLLLKRVFPNKDERIDSVQVIPLLNWTSKLDSHLADLTSQPSLESPLVHLAQPTR